MIKVKNLIGTSKEKYATPPKGYSSWLDYWEKKSEKVSMFCECKECFELAKVGAHVIEDNSECRKWYIVPLCNKCNKKEAAFYVASEALVELKR